MTYFVYSVKKYISIKVILFILLALIFILAFGLSKKNYFIFLIYFFLLLSFFNPIEIEGYYKYFLFSKVIFSIISYIKILNSFEGNKIIIDAFKIFETIIVTNIILIALSDPNFNSETEPNIVVFHEVYFRYLELHLLIFSFYFLYNDTNIEEETSKSVFVYSFSSCVGRYESFRFFTILNLSHYLFIFLNGIAYSLK